eukprot:3465328-Amphidinium_carterae.1
MVHCGVRRQFAQHRQAAESVTLVGKAANDWTASRKQLRAYPTETWRTHRSSCDLEAHMLVYYLTTNA